MNQPTRRTLLAATGLALTAGVPRARAAETVTFGWVKSTSNLLAPVCQQFAAGRGLTIESSNFNSSQDALTAMINGQLDIGLLTPIHLIRAVDSGVDVVQIAGNSRGGTGIVVSAKLGLKADDWAGMKALAATRKIRVASSRGSINEILAIAEFAKNGIDLMKQLDVTNIANFAQHPQALRSGEFDMIVTLEPLASMVVVDGTGVTFSHPYNTAAGDLNTCYVARREVVNGKPQAVQAFVGCLADAAKLLGGDKAAELAAASKLTGLPADVLTLALGNTRYDLGNSLAQEIALARLGAELHYVGHDVSGDLPGHVVDTFIKAAGVAG